MTDSERPVPEGITRGNPAGVIYGVLAVGTIIAAEGTRRETFDKLVAASVITMALYWLAHAYSQHLGSRLRQQTEWSVHEIVVALTHEAAILTGAVLPITALLGAWLAGASIGAGVTAALWCAGGELVVLEVVVALRRRQSLRGTLVEAAFGATMGIGILGIRLLLH